ncbi:MAG: DUF2188 domain-containing protein [Tissierellia bacterium]|nr:DUF2188 domain-containing protein [Tissierellia bacterium]
MTVVGSNKSEVVQKTIEIAEEQSSASVRIQTMDGKIQEERTYPKKSDPHLS